jgi:hypothetical protein
MTSSPLARRVLSADMASMQLALRAKSSTVDGAAAPPTASPRPALRVSFAPLAALPDSALREDGPLAKRLLEASGGDARTLSGAARWLTALPYGSSRAAVGDGHPEVTEPTVVFAAGQGTCTDKHRLFLALALEAGREDFEWVHGYYRLTDVVVPGIAAAARAAGLGEPFVPSDGAAPWVPSMHCFMRCDTMKRHNKKANPLAVLFFDLTDGNCDGKLRRPTEYESCRAAGAGEYFCPGLACPGQLAHEAALGGWRGQLGLDRDAWRPTVAVMQAAKTAACDAPA